LDTLIAFVTYLLLTYQLDAEWMCLFSC